MDHAGLIPKMVKEGFKGKIICTLATFELCRIMLRDSAHIQEMEAEWQNRKNIRSGQKPVEPLYTIKDVERSLNFFQPIDPDECLMISPDIEICFHTAGHILGASFLGRFTRALRASTVSPDIFGPATLVLHDENNRRSSVQLDVVALFRGGENVLMDFITYGVRKMLEDANDTALWCYPEHSTVMEEITKKIEAREMDKLFKSLRVVDLQFFYYGPPPYDPDKGIHVYDDETGEWVPVRRAAA